MLHELPLVIFTIAAQLSAGSFIVLGIIHLAAARVPQQTMDKVTDPALYAIFPLLVLGLAASTFHLGSPLRAANALRHLDGSWLSREIVIGILFLGAGLVFAALQWFKVGSHRLRQVVAVVAAALGALLVYAISQVYSLATVPAWATFHTPLRFYLTAFLLGGLSVGAALVIAAHLHARRSAPLDEDGRRLVTDSVRGIALGAIVALGLKSVGLPAYIGYLGTHPDPAAQASLDLLVTTYGSFSAAQTILVFLGVALLGFLLWGLSGGIAVRRWLPAIAVVAFVLVLGGEVIGRMLFYASMVRVGI